VVGRPQGLSAWGLPTPHYREANRMVSSGRCVEDEPESSNVSSGSSNDTPPHNSSRSPAPVMAEYCRTPPSGGCTSVHSSDPDWVPMQTRQAGLEGTGEITLRHLVKVSLRMRPSQVIVGEVRSPECLDLLLALNSGLPGMAIVHANSAREALVKLCTLPLLAGENIMPQKIEQGHQGHQDTNGLAPPDPAARVSNVQ